MSYNVNKKKEDFYQNLETLNKKLSDNDYSPLKNIFDVNSTIKPINELESFNPISDKQIIYEPRFLELTHNIFRYIIYYIAFLIGNIGDFVERIKNIFNKIFVENYFLIDCSNLKKYEGKLSSVKKNLTFYQYNCGRGFIQINEGVSRFLIFNTNDDGELDNKIINRYKDKDIGMEFTAILDLKFPIDSNIENTPEFKEFTKALKQAQKEDSILKDRFIMSISKKIGYNVIWKIPLVEEYFALGEFTKNEKKFTLKLYDSENDLITIVDLIIEDQEFKNINLYKILKEKGFIN